MGGGAASHRQVMGFPWELCYPGRAVGDSQKFRLGPFTLDSGSGELYGAGGVRRITPKATQVLLALGAPGAGVVSKEKLFETVWPRRVVSDAALASCIQELRDAFDDDARKPRILETAHRRGYRLLIPLEPLASETAVERRVTQLLVGRDSEIALLRAELRRASGGERRVVFVSGEPGIGKTTLLDVFLASGAGEFVHTTGRCVDHFGPREPYLPLLDALGSLCRGSHGERMLPLIRRHAPGWLAQLPALVDETEHAALARRAVGTTGPRMLRELADALEAAAREVPLVLRLEDLHWSDAATLDWLAFVARRATPARLLILATLRQPESLAREHPLASVYAELAPRAQSRELRLGALGADAVADYLVRRLGGRSPDDVRDVAQVIHAHTEGNPLFVVHLVDSLIEHGDLDAGGSARIEIPAETIAHTVPAQLRPLIELQLERLNVGELDLLLAAAAAGAEFSAEIVGRVRDLGVEQAESVCAGLARRGAFIGALAAVPGAADGSSHYRFLHALYRTVLYERLPSATRAALHARIGNSLAAVLGKAAAERSTELAHHFDRGGIADQAARYYHAAGERASRRGAPLAAVEHFRRALALVPQLTSPDERLRLELESCIALGGQLLASAGWGAPEAERMYARAQELCSAGVDSQESFAALWGLWMYRWGRADLPEARRLCEQLECVAADSPNRALRLQAHHAMWATSLSRGELAACSEHAAAGAALYDVAQHSRLAARFGNHDAGSCALHFRALAQALRGETGNAKRGCARAIALTEEIGHPFSHVIALYFAAAIHQTLRDVAGAEEFAARAVKVGAEHGFALLASWATVPLGWCAAVRGAGDEACLHIREAIERARATGTEQFQTYLHAVLADACLVAGAPDAARVAAQRGLEIGDVTQERFFEAELCRIVAVLAADPDTRRESLWQAMNLAQRQGAILLQLRIGVSLLETPMDAAGMLRGRQTTQEVLDRLPDDADGVDVRAARAAIDRVC
jgi:DNA-binding winged helix-turn-helix (wHTH) protein